MKMERCCATEGWVGVIFPLFAVQAGWEGKGGMWACGMYGEKTARRRGV